MGDTPKWSALSFPIVLVVTLISVAPAYAQQLVYPPTISLEEIRHRISQCPHDHPRLLTTRKELAGVAKTLDRDPLRRQVANFVIQQANILRNVEPVERKLVGRRLLGQ